MENPEEVLQALDEFQKMRPSEIPRELEEYLSWVAKTGDPVYQWSLVKPLFREKLTRVMTDFYESCPSLELAPCPNVEQFNYDIMKCNLLELLESFANAPFTVQRICELLTAPRKEYKRVDKFMRAIEKNILVVSTIEPGLAARRNENGDGMVNGSMDEETSGSHPSHEVEMESWVKDCTSESSVAITCEDGESPLLDSVISSGKIDKITTNEEISQMEKKNEEAVQRSEETEGEADSRDIVRDVVLPMENTEDATSRVETLSSDCAETASMTLEVPIGVMNEDTNSQQSLDAENNSNDSGSSRKLQTTFRPKDFVKKDEKKPQDAAAKNENENKNADNAETDLIAGTSKDEDTTQLKSENKLSFDCREADDPNVEGLPEKRARIDRLINDLENIEGNPVEENDNSLGKKDSSTVEEKAEDPASFLTASLAARQTDVKSDEKPVETIEPSDERSSSSEREKVAQEEREAEEGEEESKKEVVTELEDDSLPEADRTIEITASTKPIIEEPVVETSGEEILEGTPETREQRHGGITIEEAMDDDAKITKSIIPDPIPIIEEPKDPEPSVRTFVATTIIEELPEVVKDSSEIPETTKAVDSTVLIEESGTLETIEKEISNSIGDNNQEEDITDIRCPEETLMEEKIVEPAESMEIDGEESLPAFQQDEPMEQEPGDAVKS